jgi:hypothetical protein
MGCASTAGANALSHETVIAKVQEWLGHANVSNHTALRSAENAPRGQPNVPGEVLACGSD